MNYNEVVKKLAVNWDITQEEARDLLDAALYTLKDHLAQGTGFTIPGLGTFRTVTREERKRFNPYYSAYMLLPPKREVAFNPGKNIKEDLKYVEPEHE